MQTSRILLEMPNARFEDAGDKTALLRLTSQNGRIDSATAEWIKSALLELEKSVDAFVLDLSGCAGYDNEEIYALAIEGSQEKLEELVSRFQGLTVTIRRLSKPVVAALDGEVADFGLELAMSAAAVCVAEAAVSFSLRKNRFTPMGGGLAEITLHTYGIGENVPGHDIVPFLKRAFQQIYMGKPCQVPAESNKKGIPLTDAQAFPKDELIEKAKQKALFLFTQGYAPRADERVVTVTGGTGYAALKVTAINMREGGFVSPELYELADDAARVLGGGDVPKGTQVTETQLLKCESAAFIRACRRLSQKEVKA